MTSEPRPPVAPSRHQAWRMFDRIAGRYDLLNHLLSGGQDILWRRRLARLIRRAQPTRLADIATGTADQLLSICRRCRSIKTAVGIDMSAEMLRYGRPKVQGADTGAALALVRGDALALPLRDGAVEAVSITFGIRNVVDVERGLRELHRVLERNGQVLILEFSLPQNAIIRRGYLFYFRHLLPWFGGLISGDRQAYQYLNETVETFPYGDAFLALMSAAGFRDVQATPLTFGIATLYAGVR